MPTSSNSSAQLSSADFCSEDVTRMQQLYDCGQFLDGYQLGQKLGDISLWGSATGSPEVQILAGQLAHRLGASRLSSSILLKAYRKWPDHPPSLYCGLLEIRDSQGSVAAWLKFRDRELADDATPEQQALWAAAKATTLSRLRDFSRAKGWLDKALELAPDHPSILIQEAQFLFDQNQPEQALQNALRCLELAPRFFPPVLTAAYFYNQLDKDTDAERLLRQATQTFQSGDAWFYLAIIQQDCEDFEGAWHSIQQCKAHWPLLAADKTNQRLLDTLQCDLAYLRGDYQKACEYGQRVDQPEYQRMIPHFQRLASYQKQVKPQRICLKVPFVRQGPYGCAPATLTSILGYWNKEYCYQQVFDEICYRGTQNLTQQNWADKHGFFSRSFSPSKETTVALLRKGIPFALTVVGVPESHQVAVVGIDLELDVLLVQDPNCKAVLTLSYESLQQRNGQRWIATLFVPHDQQDMLDGIDLPDQDIFYHYHRFVVELEKSNLKEAAKLVRNLRRLNPKHWATLEASRMYAFTTGYRLGHTLATLALLKQEPENNLLQHEIWKILGLDWWKSRYLNFLRQSCGTVDSIYFKKQLVLQLKSRVKHRTEAKRLIRQLFKSEWIEGEVLIALGKILNCEKRLDDSLECNRFAVTLNTRDHHFYPPYLKSAKALNRQEEALELFEKSVQQDGNLSPLPAITMAQALEDLQRRPEAIELLESAAMIHPDNGYIHFKLALLYSRNRQASEVEKHLKAASHHYPRVRFQLWAIGIRKNLGFVYLIKRAFKSCLWPIKGLKTIMVYSILYWVHGYANFPHRLS